MATLKQYWSDEVTRLDAALGAQQLAVTTLRGEVLAAEADQRTKAEAVRTHSEAVSAARRALSAIPMPADGDPLLLSMEAAIVALRAAQAALATGDLKLQGLRAELARAEQTATHLGAERAAASQALDKETSNAKSRQTIVDKLSTGELSTLAADAAAVLALSEATARARVEGEFPSSATASSDFLKRVRERRRIVNAVAASATQVGAAAWAANSTAVAIAQRGFDAAVATVNGLADAAPTLASDSATLAALAALPAPTATTYPILTRWQHELLHDAGKKSQRENTLAKLTAVDDARDAVIAKQEIYDKAVHAAMQTEPDKTPAQLGATTLSAEKGDLDAKLADLQAARDAYALLSADDRKALDDWFAAVPDTLWEALDKLDTAVARLEKLVGPPTPANLIATLNIAETALATELAASRLAERKLTGAKSALQRASGMQGAESETALARATAYSRSSSLF